MKRAAGRVTPAAVLELNANAVLQLDAAAVCFEATAICRARTGRRARVVEPRAVECKRATPTGIEAHPDAATSATRDAETSTLIVPKPKQFITPKDQELEVGNAIKISLTVECKEGQQAFLPGYWPCRIEQWEIGNDRPHGWKIDNATDVLDWLDPSKEERIGWTTGLFGWISGATERARQAPGSGSDPGSCPEDMVKEMYRVPDQALQAAGLGAVLTQNYSAQMN